VKEVIRVDMERWESSRNQMRFGEIDLARAVRGASSHGSWQSLFANKDLA
jgi:hypothetical protein